jgi:two-component system, sensor histidine kinase and response regulator
MTDTDKTREELIEELKALRERVADLESGPAADGGPRRLFPRALDRPGTNAAAGNSGLNPLESTQSIDLSSLFTGDVTTSGSFDIRGEIWATTFGRVLQALPIPALMVDEAFRVVAANQAWARLGVSAEAIRSTEFADLFCGAEARKNAQYLIEEVFSSRKPRLWQTVMEVNGKKIWGRLTFRSIRVMRERFVLALVENLTREKAQLQANERLRVTLENIVKKRTQALAQSNEQLKQEIASRRYAQGELREAYDKLANVNTVLENRVRERTVQLETANKELQEEIARRKSVEEALRESEELHRTIVETALEGIWVMDSDLRTTYVNSTMARILGYPLSEMLGKTVTHFIHKEHLADHEKRIENRKAGLRERYELSFLRKDGGEVWALVSATPLRDETGEFTGSFAMFTDITERKRMENALTEAKEAAEAANRAKSEFLARMSHEIRTPINGIVGMTELALESELTPVQRNYLECVALSADALLRIIDEILDFSRIEAGKFAIVSSDFSLRECVFDAMVAHSIQAAAKDIELVCHVSPDVPEAVCGDRGRLGQILVNLAGNAVKFTEQGEVRATVQVEDLGTEDVLLHFCVSDTGIGVSEEDRERVFEPFEQAEGSTTRRHGGSGLGLAICRHLVTLMGGRIWLETEVEKGSAFHFTVRLGLQKHAEQWPPAAAVSMLKELKALIADDHAATRAVLHELLASWGMQPHSFASGDSTLVGLREALKKGHPFDVAILNAMMTGMNGLEVAESLRKEPGLEGTHIVMLGFARGESDEQECRRLGIESRLSKPVRPSELLRALLRGVHGAAPEQASQTVGVREKLTVSSRPLNVLLVEDNRINRQVAETMLRRMGHSVTLAVNGKEAVSLAREQAFDVILMDVEMPEMDGIEATEIIRSSEKTTGKRTPIIALTAHAMAGHKEVFLAAGMDGYVAKPIKYKTLYDTVEEYAALVTHDEEPDA